MKSNEELQLEAVLERIRGAEGYLYLAKTELKNSKIWAEKLLQKLREQPKGIVVDKNSTGE